MKKVGLFAKTNTDEALVLAEEFLDFAKTRELEVFLEKELATKLNLAKGYPGEEISQHVDFIVVMGGDGTLLSVVQKSRSRRVPVMGVNLGHLGFLTEVQKEEVYQVLDNVLSGDMVTEERMMFEVRQYRNDELLAEASALNDAVVRGKLARIITVDIFVNDEYLNTFRADGIIVSTPTGSTAYSMAAGGPIVHPALPAILFAPICPHLLSNRPIVIPGDSRVRIVLKHSSLDGALLSVDGQKMMSMIEGDKVEVFCSPEKASLIRPRRLGYYELLRTKLNWGT